jgi:hypothetical protein
MLTFADAIAKMPGGESAKVAVFEFNSGNHTQRRALANALAINALERDGRVPVATSANGLQVDGQNDNGWDQGLIFMNPGSVWRQPPGEIAAMIAGAYQPWAVAVSGAAGGLDVSAKTSDDGRHLTLTVVNAGDAAQVARLKLTGFSPTKEAAQGQQLAADLAARNTAAEPQRVAPAKVSWRLGDPWVFPAHSVTVLTME